MVGGRGEAGRKRFCCVEEEKKEEEARARAPNPPKPNMSVWSA